MVESPTGIDLWKGTPSPQRRFQLAEQMAAGTFRLGQELTKTELQRLGISDQVIIVGNSKIKPENFDLRGVDYQPIEDFVIPGKSAMIDFLGIQNIAILTDVQRDICTERTFGKKSDRHDCVWSAPVGQINETGWKIFYAPVRTNGLHIRLVWGQHAILAYPVQEALSIPRFGLDKISTIWTRKRC